jgi:transcriptional regulator with XRE-family HTH domain
MQTEFEEKNTDSNADLDLSPTTLGARIQRLRIRQGLSVRDIADKAEVDKNTVLRLEKGLPTSARTRDRVCAALGVYVSRLALPEPDEREVVVKHSREREVWWPYPGMGEPSALPLLGSTPVEELFKGEDAAMEKAAEQLAAGYVTSLACRMPHGRLRSSLLKLYEETTANMHPGEEFCFCLRGRALLTVSGKTTLLEEGDAATFWCAEPHTYAPASGAVPPGEPPILLLTVWLDAREERK